MYIFSIVSFQHIPYLNTVEYVYLYAFNKTKKWDVARDERN